MAKKKDVSAREMRTLPVRLSDDELLGYGDEAARLFATAQAHEDRLGNLIKEERAEIAEQKSHALDLLRRVREKHEDREVECERIADFGAKKLRVTRLDTGEVVQERALTFDELQGRLFVVEPGTAKESE
jgi:hypothetical protein